MGDLETRSPSQDAANVSLAPTPYLLLDQPPLRIYLTDCVDGMRQVLSRGSVSVVVTSPPYNIGVRYRSYDDGKSAGAYLDWIERVAEEIRRVLEPEGSLFLNMGTRPGDPWVAWDVANRLRKQLVLQNVIHWIKSISIEKKDVGNYPGLTGDIAVGHYKPITSPRFLHDCHEYVFHFTQTGNVPLNRLAIGVPYQDKTNIGRWKSAKRDVRCRGNTWFITYKTIRDRATQRPHPSTFPAELPEMCIKLHGLSRTKRVLDPFMGIGSTAAAAQRLGVDCVGFEIEQYYLDVASSRLRDWGGRHESGGMGLSVQDRKAE